MNTALIVAMMFAAGAPAPKKEDKKKADPQVRCSGVNECKGKGACGGANGSSCAGNNECKGKGWVLVTAKECKDKKGTILE